MMRGKIIKRRTKNRETLLRNLRKGKARLEGRCAFKTIPLPLKLAYTDFMYHLCADLVVMEHQNTIVLEASLINSYKIYKQAQVCNFQNHKLVKVLVENRFDQPMNWKYAVDRLLSSDSSQLREWAMPVKDFCEKYELIQQDLQTKTGRDVPHEVVQSLKSMNDIAEKSRASLIKNFPHFELKYQFKNGQVQLTEVIFNEKFLRELGYSIENFATTILQEGFPKLISFEHSSCAQSAKFRLEKFLSTDKEGYVSREFETTLLMKSGFMKKVNFQSHYYHTYEKGIPGYSIFINVTSRQTPFLEAGKVADVNINSDFVALMSNKERDMADFLSTFYDKEGIEMRYTHLDKVCQFREI